MIVETAIDGKRIARELAETNEVRRVAEMAQSSLLIVKVKRVFRKRRHERTPKRTPKRLKPIKSDSAE